MGRNFIFSFFLLYFFITFSSSFLILKMTGDAEKWCKYGVAFSAISALSCAGFWIFCIIKAIFARFDGFIVVGIFLFPTLIILLFGHAKRHRVALIVGAILGGIVFLGFCGYFISVMVFLAYYLDFWEVITFIWSFGSLFFLALPLAIVTSKAYLCLEKDRKTQARNNNSNNNTTTTVVQEVPAQQYTAPPPQQYPTGYPPNQQGHPPQQQQGYPPQQQQGYPPQVILRNNSNSHHQ